MPFPFTIPFTTPKSLKTMSTPDVSSEYALWAEGIEMVYQNGEQSFRALKGVDLKTRSGDIQLLMGPSGSGKTTLLSILGGILTPTAGQVFLLGQDITQLSRHRLAQFRLKNIGFIFQGFNLFPALTASENIEAALELKGIHGREARLQAQKLLTQVGLADKTHTLPKDLSGGQKQRIAIARSLTGKPRLIMADEPTAALDSQRGRAVIELLRSLAKEEGCTVIMVTHDPRIIDIADRVVAVEDGEIIPEGSYSHGPVSPSQSETV
jgi:putative ABC transport system ATP-binding protein